MKNTPLIIGVIVVILAAIGGYVFMQNRSGNSMIGSDNRQMAESGDSKMMSLKELMNLGQSQMCTFSSTTEEGTVNGTSYIANGKVRTDFSGTDQTDIAYSGGMIMDSEYMYTWTNEKNEGVKMPIATFETDTSTGESQDTAESYQQAPINPNEQTEYSCSAWNVDSSVFTPPSTVTFLDMTEQMQMYQNMMQEQNAESTTIDPSEKQNACAACASLSGDAATACKQALSCQ